MIKKAIICVDDEKLVLSSLRRELEDILGDEYYIEIALSGREALDVFNDLRTDEFDIPIIISDYIMPEMKGDELLIRFHKIDSKPIKIILSGQMTNEAIDRAMKEGNIFKFINKPWDHEKLISILCDAISSYYGQ